MRARLVLCLLLTVTFPAAKLPAQTSVGTEDTTELLQHAEDAFAAGHKEDAIFYAYAASLRFDYELLLFPPRYVGGIVESVAAYESDIEEKTEAAAATDPSASLRALDRLERWRPTLTPRFSPPWQCSHPRTPAAVRVRMQAKRSNFFRHTRIVMHLLGNPAYAEQYRVAQDCRQKTGTEQPQLSACNAANLSLKRMERESAPRGRQ